VQTELKEILCDKSKNLFLGLSFISLLIYWFLALFLSILIKPGIEHFIPQLNLIVQISLILFLTILSGGLIIIILSVQTGLDLLYPHRKKQITLTTLFPMNVLIGKLFNIKKDRIRFSYIALNNALWAVQSKRLDGSRLLILLPHCLQWIDCPFKITHKIENCQKCGKCSIADVVKIAKKNHIHVAVATGGTLARKIIVDFKPTFIIAVACERDLSIGITEVYPIPVFGILNQRPHGPCINTSLDTQKLEKIIHLVLKNF